MREAVERVSVALEMLTKPALLFLDEPTSGLDPGLDRQVMILLRELADAGHTIIVITHDRDVAAQARRVIEISDGRVVNDSAPDGIQSRAEVPPLTPQRNTSTSAIIAIY